MMLSLIQALTFLTTITHITHALPTVTTQDACTSITKALPGKVELQGSARYKKENKDYYNAQLAELTPACIIFPTSAEDVAATVKILNANKDVQFAVKSGGHSPNAGQASIKDGVLIALRDLKGTKLNKETNLAELRPGGHWWDVMKALDGTGRIVVGGRLGVVGIGGYLTQGGVSFLSGQYGLGGDNVVEYETVLANGSIVNLNQERHPEIVRAMRGGGSMFGMFLREMREMRVLGLTDGGI
jgi:FAD/FMN-containing dehydrogenase